MSIQNDEIMASFLALMDREFPGALALPQDIDALAGMLPPDSLFVEGHALAECPYRPILEVWTACMHLLWEHKREQSARLDKIDARLEEDRARWESTSQAIDELACQMAICREDYAALSTAHEDLQLEHTDLEAAYFVLQRRVSKEEC